MYASFGQRGIWSLDIRIVTKINWKRATRDDDPLLWFTVHEEFSTVRKDPRHETWDMRHETWDMSHVKINNKIKIKAFPIQQNT